VPHLSVVRFRTNNLHVHVLPRKRNAFAFLPACLTGRTSNKPEQTYLALVQDTAHTVNTNMLQRSIAQSRRVAPGVARTSKISAQVPTHQQARSIGPFHLGGTRASSNFIIPLAHRRARVRSFENINNNVAQLASMRFCGNRANLSSFKSASSIQLTGWETPNHDSQNGKGNNNKNDQNNNGKHDWWWAGHVSALAAVLLALVVACTTPINSAYSEKSDGHGRVSVETAAQDTTKASITPAAADPNTTDESIEDDNSLETYGSLKEFRARFKCLKVCIYISVHICINVSMYQCIYVSMYLCIYVSMYLCIYASLYLCISMHLCIYMLEL
jgi:hypothetical protein